MLPARLCEQAEGSRDPTSRSQPPASVSPLAYLSAGQLARYRPVAQAWLDDPRHASPVAQTMRFDAIGVLVDAEGAVVDLRHVEG
jgi:hypothetical protein